MDHSPEAYSAYWQGAIRIAIGVLACLFGYRFASPFLAHAALGARGLGLVLFVGILFMGCFVATLGIARIFRTAIREEKRG